MKRLLLATFFLLPLTGCSSFPDSSILQPKEDFIYLECSRPESKEWKEWTIKLEIDFKNNTIDSYNQSDNFSEAYRYSSEFVTITNRFIKFDKPRFEKNTVDRKTGIYIAEFQDITTPKYSCKKIRSKNLF